jgi:transketolase
MKRIDVKELSKIAASARIKGLDAIHCANSGHVGGAFSIVDILSVLFFETMNNIDPKNPRNPDRDRLVMSKGHGTAALYPVLALRGFFPVEDLKTFRHIDSYLSGHVEMTHIPGVDMSAGSLGQGLSAAVGMALAGKMDNRNYRVYAIMGDGEIQEGMIWEAAMSAAKYKLDNLVGILDYNKLQIDGTIEEIMPLEPVAGKWSSFGWEVLTVDGHDYEKIADIFDQAAKIKGKPVMVIARTIKGKGVSLFADNVAWHGHVPNEEQFRTAMDELEKTLKALEG